MLKRIYFLNAFLILGFFSWSIYSKEQILSTGASILIPLAPVDPRSLMQGDYMRLRYDLGSIEEYAEGFDEGYLVYTTDNRHVVKFERAVESLPTNERAIRFKRRKSELWIGATSFFFQEGKESYFSMAKYGELKVDPKGNTILVGLRDGGLKAL